MNRDQIYQEIEETFGLVPAFFEVLPDSSLELEWELYKRVHVEEGPVPHKYRELVGLGMAAAMKCPYCLFYHTEMAKLHGATEAEIEDAMHFVKSSMGWSAYVTGLQLDLEQFKAQISQACDHVRAVHAGAP
jgi:AhpD family alkylhydroperoxidase